MLENPKQAKRSKKTHGKGVGLSMTSRVCQQMTRISKKSNTIMTKEGDMCKTRENSNFLKNGKMVISDKIQNFFRSWMTKQTSPLESSCEM